MKKIYGMYSGFLNSQDVENYPEIELFYMIYVMKSMLSMMKLDNINDVNEEIYTLEYCIYQTKKYGVDIEKPINGEHVVESDSFKLWYNWWKEYFDFDLSQNMWYICRQQNYEYCDIESFKPQGDWKEKELKKSL